MSGDVNTTRYANVVANLNKVRLGAKIVSVEYFASFSDNQSTFAELFKLLLPWH